MHGETVKFKFIQFNKTQVYFHLTFLPLHVCYMFRPALKSSSSICTQECSIGCIPMGVSEPAENIFGPKTD